GEGGREGRGRVGGYPGEVDRSFGEDPRLHAHALAVPGAGRGGPP
ncbi:hypothetical protein NGA_2090700, partial [Nannochloropsis gaditana CCMP526]